jgi:hypothetical protein
MDSNHICPSCRNPLAADALQGLCPECLAKAGLGSGMSLGPETELGHPHFTAPPVEELARSFPQLDLMRLIGQGGMGAVYQARQKQLDRVVALKILPPSIGEDPAFAARFGREARALAKLNHPGIVTVHDFGQAEGLYYFVMEFVDGMNLRQLLQAGRIAPREALAIVPQICDALQYAHDQGIVHRDIKPENILLDRRGRVKVADFGLAKLVRADGPACVADEEGTAAPAKATTPASSLTEFGRILGTPNYIAPEQLECPADADHRADIYALGVVLYQMLTGELPGKPLEPPSRKVQLDVRLDEVLLRALENKPELRYQQASILKTELETIARTSSPGSATVTAPGATPRKSGMVHFVELWFDITFTSSAAIKCLNLSALGFLGSLGFLGTAPLPGAHALFGLFGFSGFFGLIGVGFLVELVKRRKDRNSSGPPRTRTAADRISLLAELATCSVALLLLFAGRSDATAMILSSALLLVLGGLFFAFAKRGLHGILLLALAAFGFAAGVVLLVRS